MKNRDRITRAVIPAAGLGTRLLSVTKEQPKEMLPVFSKEANSELALKPVVQLVFEALYDCSFREFCFIVGRGKRAIEDHFTPDPDFISLLKRRGKRPQAEQLLGFYRKVKNSSLAWVNQSVPLGFGHAVLASRSVIGNDRFMVHAGDNHVISRDSDHIRRMLRAQTATKSDATLLLREVDDPRIYGVAEVEQKGDIVTVKGVAEKPERPRTKLAILPTYVFRASVFDSLESVESGKGGEIQLTDGIQDMIERGLKVTAVELRRGEFWLDVGTPETYWQALNHSHSYYSGRRV